MLRQEELILVNLYDISYTADGYSSLQSCSCPHPDEAILRRLQLQKSLQHLMQLQPLMQLQFLRQLQLLRRLQLLMQHLLLRQLLLQQQLMFLQPMLQPRQKKKLQLKKRNLQNQKLHLKN